MVEMVEKKIHEEKSFEFKEKKKNKNDRRIIVGLLIPALASLAFFNYFPAISGIKMAFQNYKLYDIHNIYWIGLDNFRKILSDRLFLQTIPNTITWVLVSLFFQFTIGMALALMLRKNFRGKRIYESIIFLPWALSGFMIGLIWRWLFNGQSGVVNDILMRLGVIAHPIGFLSSPELALPSAITANVWYGIAFFAIMISAALKTVPSELYESAEIDGATGVHKFFHITLPYIKPVLIVTTLLRVMWIINMPDLIFSMTGGGPAGSSNIITSHLMLQILNGSDYGMIAAGALLLSLFMVVYTLAYLAISKFEKAGDF